MNSPLSRVPDPPVPALNEGRQLAPGYPQTVRLEPGNFSGEEGTNYRQLFYRYLGIALKHRWLLIIFCSTAIVLGLVVTFAAVPQYRARTTIQIDREAAKIVKVDGPDVGADTGDTLRFYQTQYDLLKSRSLAERVAINLDLGNSQTFLAPPKSPWSRLWAAIFPSAVSDQRNLSQRVAAATRIIQGGLTVSPVLNSRLVTITFQSHDPESARKIADGVADNFVSSSLDRRYGATTYARNFLKERLEELKLKLEESEKALVAYAEKQEILTTKDRPSFADTDLTALQNALQQVKTERIRAEQLWQQASSAKGLNLPQFLNDKSIETLRESRAKLSTEYQEKLGLFRPDYPDMRKLKSQIDQIEKEIASAADVIRGSLKANYQGLVAQEMLLDRNIAAAKTGVLDSRNKNIQYQILQRESDTNRTLYDGLLQQYKDVGVSGAVGTNNIAVIDRAQRPGAPFEPNLFKNLMYAFLLGALIAAAVIAVLEILDDTFKSAEQIEEELGLSVLGMIPRSQIKNIFSEVIEKPMAPIAEAYRSLRTAVQFSTPEGAPKNLIVTSARPGEGKSTTAVMLATNFAQLGMRVLLIDGDMRNPSAHKILGCQNTMGLANYLSGQSGASDIIQSSSVKGLFFISTGPLPPNPAELLAGSKMAALLSTAGESFDSIIIDAPPVLGLADAPLLASVASGTLLVISNGETRRGIVAGALKRLHFARARVIGTVLNKYDFRAATYGAYGYGYGYGAGYGYGYGELDHYGYGAKTPKLEHNRKG